MDIKTLVVGSMGTNCYLAVDEETAKTFIIDPGDEADFITTTILENRLSPVGILLTHGHYDHCLGSLELKLNFSLPIYLHKKDLFLYRQAHLSAKHFSGLTIPELPTPDCFLSDGQDLVFGSSILTTNHTPGHTPGSVCFTGHQTPTTIFTGDTLFADGVGRTDLSYSSKMDLNTSINKISNLASKIEAYPGHGESFSLPNSNLYL